MLPKPVDGKCHECGSADLILCEDMTRYTPVRLVGVGWELDGEYLEHTNAENSVRLMCTECGEYHAVPKELA